MGAYTQQLGDATAAAAIIAGDQPLEDESVAPVATKLLILGVILFLWKGWK